MISLFFFFEEGSIMQRPMEGSENSETVLKWDGWVTFSFKSYSPLAANERTEFEENKVFSFSYLPALSLSLSLGH